FSVPRWIWFAASAVLVVLALAFRSRVYTLTVFLSVAAFFALTATVAPGLLESRHFWLAVLLTYIPFLIFNGLLTAVPIVVYNDAENLGVRVYTIPLEDFFYSFSLLGFNFLVFRLLRGRVEARNG
ncbi:MAG: lycopene cyclase domain-containing protein, partial [Spirochaetales bacterium]|nr:lycopene cyclase domain-containing protein [Spirochaetales bacterium]